MTSTVLWPDDAAVLDAAASLIAPFEGFRPAPYLCPAGKWTIGYGATFYPGDKPVGPHDPPIDKARAMALLRADCARRWAGLKGLLHHPPTVGQAAAMVSLAYNIGVGAFAKSSVCSLFNAGDVAGAADVFLSYDKATVNGARVHLPGLTRRRAAERNLFLKGEPT